MQYAPYQGPKFNRPQSNPGLLHSPTLLCCCRWRIIHVMDKNRHLVLEVFYWVSYPGFEMTNPWLPRPASPGNPYWMGLCGADQKSCYVRWLLPRIRNFVAAQVCTLAHHEKPKQRVAKSNKSCKCGVALSELHKIQATSSFQLMEFEGILTSSGFSAELPPSLLMKLLILGCMKRTCRIIPYRNQFRPLAEIRVMYYDIIIKNQHN